MDRRLVIIGGVVAGVIAVAVGWYLISPLFINVSVDEGFPTAVATEKMATMAVEATAAMEEAMKTEMPPMEEPMPEDEAAEEEMTILLQGTFYDVAHHGMGTATIYELSDGSRILRFENFEVLNGPELHVYFTSETTVADRVGRGLENGYDLGLLKGNIGNQNYVIPNDLDLSQFNSVVIWCEPFAVPFNAALLVAP